MKSKYPFLLAAVTLVLSGLASCACDEPKSTGRRPELRTNFVKDETGAADWLVDFGEVPLGTTAVETINLRNAGTTELRLQASGVGRPFAVDLLEGGTEVAPGADLDARFRFAPDVAREESAVITLLSNEGGEGTSRRVRLVGIGVVPTLRCSPDPIDFGRVILGSARTLETVCTNLLDVGLDVSGLELKGHFASSFRVRAVGDTELPTSLPAGGSLRIEVEFHSDRQGANQATLVVAGSQGMSIAELRLSAEGVASSLELDPSGCLDFGYVAEGERSVKELRLKNLSTEPIEVTGFRFGSDTSGSFSVETAAPLTVLAGEVPPTELSVAFEPTRAGRMVETLTILTVDELLGSTEISACVSGFGGGPKLVCSPNLLDFGAVSVEEPARRLIRCENGGSAPEGEPVDPLFITGLSVDHLAFNATILDADGAPSGPRPSGYAIGEGFELEVAFAPYEEAQVFAELQIETNGAPSGIYPISLAGDGRGHLPCELSISPPEVRFGTWEIGSESTRSFLIENVLHSACLIESIRLAETSESVFSMVPSQSLSLQGFGSMWVDVNFAPDRHKERFEGAVEIHSFGGELPATVKLSGRSAEQCLLVEPAPLDFGKVIPGCTSRSRNFTIHNVCTEPVRLMAIDIEPEAGEAPSFFVERRPPLPQLIQPSGQLEASFYFLPSEVGVREGALSLSVDAGIGDRDIYISRLRGEGAGGDLLQTDRFTQADKPKVDVLWVMDNSQSFNVVHEAVMENLPAFLSTALRERVDFNLALTTSGLTSAGTPHPDHACPGGAAGGEDGRFFPIDGSTPRILRPDTPNLDEVWKTNIWVGTCHTVEEYYEAAYRALSEPLISADKDPRYFDQTPYYDGNQGFLRSDAHLSIIFAADERDQSIFYGKTVPDYLHFFQGLKGRNRRLFKAHAITGRKSTESVLVAGACLQQDPQYFADRILYSVEETGGVRMDVCTPKWDTARWVEGLTRMSEGIFANTRRFVLRSSPADQNGDLRVNEDDMVVEIDGVEISPVDRVTGERRWSFDPIGNEIFFEPEYAPDFEAEIAVTYTISCMEAT